MKILILLLTASFPASAATFVISGNMRGASYGYPIIDNSGIPINKTHASWSVGTFPQEFATIIGSLDETTDDQLVIDTFIQSGDSGNFSFNGLFNRVIIADEGNVLAGQPLYAMVVYRPSPSCVQALIFDFSTTFPIQDTNHQDQAVEYYPIVSDIVFGGNFLVPVNTDSLPPALQRPEYQQGFSFGDNLNTPTCIPEPSTSLLALLGLASLLKRRRP